MSLHAFRAALHSSIHMMETGDLDWEGFYPKILQSSTTPHTFSCCLLSDRGVMCTVHDVHFQGSILFISIVTTVVMQNYLAPHRVYLLILAVDLTYLQLIRPLSC